jgi:F-type H+-transporting ATPase subunit gamma
MAGEKEIRSKIASVKNMQKITSAMEKVAASKIRKAQAQMEASRPYAQRIRRVIGHLAHANPDYKHPFLTEREVNRVGFIVISTDRGLCGGLNANLFKAVIGEIADWQEKDVGVDMVLVGAKAVQFFRRMGGSVLGTATHLGDQPSVNDLIGSIKIMLSAYEDGKIDRLFLVSNCRRAVLRRMKTSCKNTGTISTSRMPVSCSTTCWDVTSNHRFIAVRLKTSRAKWRQKWWR